jgi:hypothetical protein
VKRPPKPDPVNRRLPTAFISLNLPCLWVYIFVISHIFALRQLLRLSTWASIPLPLEGPCEWPCYSQETKCSQEQSSVFLGASDPLPRNTPDCTWEYFAAPENDTCTNKPCSHRPVDVWLQYHAQSRQSSHTAQPLTRLQRGTGIRNHGHIGHEARATDQYDAVHHWCHGWCLIML